MKRLSVFFGGTMFLALMLSLTAFKSLPAARPSSNGGADISSTTFAGTLTGHISFHANTMPQGDVQGNGVFTYTDGTAVEFDLNCLTVMGTQAVMTGVITSGDHPYLIGQQVYIRVVDNGEGAGSSGDQIAVIFGNYGLPCDEAHGALSSISAGNIQVKP